MVCRIEYILNNKTELSCINISKFLKKILRTHCAPKNDTEKFSFNLPLRNLKKYNLYSTGGIKAYKVKYDHLSLAGPKNENRRTLREIASKESDDEDLSNRIMAKILARKNAEKLCDNFASQKSSDSEVDAF